MSESAANPIVDPALKEWATEEQQRLIDAINEHGGYRPAARALGCRNNLNTMVHRLKARAARSGYSPDHGLTRTTAPGFRAKRVSTYYFGNKKQGLPAQWVIQEPDKAQAEKIMRAWVDELVDSGGARGLCPVTPAPELAVNDLLAAYCIGDPHFGMKAWSEESGDNFDLTIAERLTKGAVDRLVTVAPQAHTGLLLQIGDMFHADDNSHRTPGSGHPLDVDTRHQKVMMVGIRAMVHCIRRMLEKHQKVIFWGMAGNHDIQSSYALSLCLAAYFENEPRVTVDLSPGLFKYMRHGKVLIGAHHGDKVKMDQLPLLMAVDRPEDWGQTRHRYQYVGHVHHDQVKEIQGVRVESLRTLAAKDGWHAGMGYRAGRDMRLIVHHSMHGEVERHTCGISMLEQTVA